MRCPAWCSKFVRTLKRGDVLRAELAGSGGYGDPFERDPQEVLEDVRQGKVKPDHAQEAYGVVIDGDSTKVDREATDRLRDRAKGKAGQD